MNINPFIDLIAGLVNLYDTALFAWIILSLLVRFEIINPRQYLVQRISYFLDRIIEPVLSQIRQIIRPIGGVDLSPLILIFLLRFIVSSLYTYFYR